MKWQLITETPPQNSKELVNFLLNNRAISQNDQFFSFKHPMELSLDEVEIDSQQVQQAVSLLAEIKKTQGKVLIFGDYDADGICSTALLWQVLDQLGFNVSPFIPHREKHGYGISMTALSEILESDSTKPNLVITVDNGIVAHEPIQYLRSQGIDVILTDHHQPDGELPNATAIVHSDRLCGGGVAWMFAREVVASLAPEKTQLVEDQLDLVGIATVADQVPLIGPSRSFAGVGVQALRKSQRLGIKLLLKIANRDQNTIDTSDINFALAPRINAMGRLAHGLPALELLTTQDYSLAESLVGLLNDTNTQRQDMTYQMVGDADLQVEAAEDQKIIIVASPDYHEGVIGLIAGKLSEKYYRPAIAISISENGTAKGSARSIPGVNIVELLREVKGELLDVGGHPMAAGFSLETEKLEVFKSKLTELANAELTAEMLEPSLTIEMPLSLELVNLALVEEINQFAPFGASNQRPIFAFYDLTVVQAMVLGRDGNHLKLQLHNGSLEQQLTAIGWNLGEHAPNILPGQKLNVAAMIDLNEWRGRRSVQLLLKDIQLIP